MIRLLGELTVLNGAQFLSCRSLAAVLQALDSPCHEGLSVHFEILLCKHFFDWKICSVPMIICRLVHVRIVQAVIHDPFAVLFHQHHQHSVEEFTTVVAEVILVEEGANVPGSEDHVADEWILCAKHFAVVKDALFEVGINQWLFAWGWSRSCKLLSSIS